MVSFLDILTAQTKAAPRRLPPKPASALSRPTFDEDFSSETSRAVAVPRRTILPDGDLLAIADHLKRPPRSGIDPWSIRPVQAQALKEIQECRGFLGSIGVGHGKTLISFLAPSILEAVADPYPCVILIPSAVRDGFFAEWSLCAQHFVQPPRNMLHVMTYEELSTRNTMARLNTIQPKLIIADECQNLRRFEAARTKRFCRFMDAHPDTMFVAMSGTLTTNEPSDYAHLANYALGSLSPLPRPIDDDASLQSWNKVLGYNKRPTDSDWLEFSNLSDVFGGASLHSEADDEGRLDTARKAYLNRLLDCNGTLLTEESSCDTRILMTLHDFTVPDNVKEVFESVRENKCTPDGEDYFAAEVDTWRALTQLSFGFYYTWDWPDGIINSDWRDRRCQWNRFVNKELSDSSDENYDSMALVRDHIIAQLEEDPSLVATSDLHWAWADWAHKICPLHNVPFVEVPEPPRKPVWVDPYAIDEVIRLANESAVPTIFWYQSEAVETALRSTGMPVYGKGEQIPRDNPHTCAASLLVHGTGLNLQAWHRMVVVEVPSSGSRWEQLIGRMHRQNQTHDVEVVVFQHTDVLKKSFAHAMGRAAYMEQTQGQAQKLLIAEVINE